jgi:hypothetical protein
MVASAIYVLDLKGKVLISRDYRGDVPKSAIDKCVLCCALRRCRAPPPPVALAAAEELALHTSACLAVAACGGGGRARCTASSQSPLLCLCSWRGRRALVCVAGPWARPRLRIAPATSVLNASICMHAGAAPLPLDACAAGSLEDCRRPRRTSCSRCGPTTV